jgi:hypothetical protein
LLQHVAIAGRACIARRAQCVVPARERLIELRGPKVFALAQIERTPSAKVNICMRPSRIWRSASSTAAANADCACSGLTLSGKSQTQN